MPDLVKVYQTAAHRHGMSIDQWRRRIAAGLKWCWRCRRWLYAVGPHGKFGRDTSRGDWTRAACRECCRAMANDRWRRIRGVVP